MRQAASHQAKLVRVAQPDRARPFGFSALTLRAAFEAPEFVSGLDDLAMMGEPIEQRGGHLGIAEDGGPFAECQVGGGDDAGALIELGYEVEEQLPASLGKGEIAEFVEHNEVEPGQVIGDAALPAGAGLIEEAPACAVADEGAGNGDGQKGIARVGAADQDDNALIGSAGFPGKITDQALVDRRACEAEVDVLGQRATLPCRSWRSNWLPLWTPDQYSPEVPFESFPV